MQYLVIIGATSGLLASLIAIHIGLSRLLFYLAQDGLLFNFLGYYNEKKGTTINATIMGCLLASLIALLVKKITLFYWLGTGSLVSCLSASIAILCLRYGSIDKNCSQFDELFPPSSSSAYELSESTNASDMSTFVNCKNNCHCNECANYSFDCNYCHQTFTPIDCVHNRLYTDCYLNRRNGKQPHTSHNKVATFFDDEICKSQQFKSKPIDCPLFKCDKNRLKSHTEYEAIVKPTSASKFLAVDFYKNSFVSSIKTIKCNLQSIDDELPSKESASRVKGK